MEKKYPNNWIWPGVTALMYNVDLSKYFDWDDSISEGVLKSNYINSLSDVGFQWKISSASSWTTISLKRTSSTYINDYFADLKGYAVEFEGQYAFDIGFGVNGIVVPTTVVIMELSSNTSYDVRMYGTVNGTTSYYNSQTVKTLEATNTIDYDEIEFDDEASDEFKEFLPQALDAAVDVLKMFYNGNDWHIIPKTEHVPGVSWVAYKMPNNDEIVFNSANSYTDIDFWRTVTIHEMGHKSNLFVEDGNNPEQGYYDYIMKFMEFATGMGQAMWRWQGAHNYPIISSATYPFVKDCKVVAAFQLWHTYQEEQ